MSHPTNKQLVALERGRAKAARPLSHPTNEQLIALGKLYQLAKWEHCGSSTAVQFLLSLYDGRRFPFDLTNLRRFEQWTMECALHVLVMDWCPKLKVHEHLAVSEGVTVACMSYEFEAWAHKWRLKGRCKKAVLDQLKARAFPEGAPA